jgi:predicted branched-subunit amino acid permease
MAAFGRLRPLWQHPEFRASVRDMGTVAPGIAAWGLVTGMAMVQSGLGVPLALFMSLTVFAGSAQLAALPLMSAGAPVWVVWLTALCVNLRFVIFSAQWRPYLIRYPLGMRMRIAYFTADLNTVMFMRRFPRAEPAPEQLPYFWGGTLLNYGSWQVASVAGILFADRIPRHWDVGFAGTMALLGIACSLMTGRAGWVAAAVAGAAALASYALPLKLNIVVAIAAAVAVALVIDHASAATPPSQDKT